VLEGRHYQNAYVTRNLGKAVAAFTATADVRSSVTLEAATEVLAPTGRRTQTLKMAFIWIGGDLVLAVPCPRRRRRVHRGRKVARLS
jgi:hypothetical protein